ncbi:glycerophosphodiester phosphodiesterase family protein [Hellea balneolensis]|uniref:glycerophosphodiester phosphodiesterase family protein n=1 Tax=Hellea balneolensis TaxID=287478 RepID=UPI000405232B|nr:glycerophosphodiester phosphodiesterase family protein [Hellea balneolensis]
MRKRTVFGFGFTSAMVCIYLMNASWIVGMPDGDFSLLAHPGVHQTYHREGLTNATCTAERIDPPAHGFIENTISSMRAAIEAGADIIELDVKLTTDGEIVVFHDATLDCRTNGSGKTHHHSLSELQALDIGYGYTPDGGQTYPFRGEFIGIMPTLREVLTVFPETNFMVNLKHSKASEGEVYRNYITATDAERLGLVAPNRAAAPIIAAYPDMILQTRQNVKACLRGYTLTGWYGGMPESCKNTYVSVPSNLRYFIWGWPHRFEKRLQAVGSRSMLLGPYEGNGSVGIDTPKDLNVIPKNYTGIVFTNKIEVIGPQISPN